jgi:hypothetical protein
VVSPDESPIKVESKIFDVVLAGKLQIVQVDGRASATACSERDVQRLGGIGMHLPLVEPVLNGKEVGLEFLGGSCRVAVGTFGVARLR